MSATKNTGMEARSVEHKLTPPKAESDEGAKATASLRTAAPKRKKPSVAAASPDSKASARGVARDLRAAAAPARKAPNASQENQGAAGPDFERLSVNLARFVEQAGRVLAAYFAPAESGGATDVSGELTDALRSISRIAARKISGSSMPVISQSLKARQKRRGEMRARLACERG